MPKEEFDSLDKADIVVYVKDGEIEGLFAMGARPLKVRCVEVTSSEASDDPFVGRAHISNTLTDPFVTMPFDLKALLDMDYRVVLKEKQDKQFLKEST